MLEGCDRDHEDRPGGDSMASHCRHNKRRGKEYVRLSWRSVEQTWVGPILSTDWEFGPYGFKIRENSRILSFFLKFGKIR